MDTDYSTLELTEVTSLEEPSFVCEYGEEECSNEAHWLFVYTPCNKCGNSDNYIFCDIHKEEVESWGKRSNYTYYCDVSSPIECLGSVKLVRIERV